MRRPTACVSCRARRRKCEITPAARRCAYCVAKNISCVRSGSSPGTATLDDEAQQHDHVLARSPLLTAQPGRQSLCRELIELYFTYIHDQYHTLFHRPSFMDSLAAGTASPAIVYAMMALTARFSDNAVFEDIPITVRGEEFSRKSEALLNLREMSLTTIRVCVLLGAACIGDGNAEAESVYYATACRVANILDLPSMPADDPITREIHIRIYWTLCMIDLWSSDGLQLPRQMTRSRGVPLPMDEMVFLQMRSSDEGHVSPVFMDDENRRCSLLAQMINLNCILLEVNDGIKAITAKPSRPNSDEMVDYLSSKLDTWERDLPDHMRDTCANMHAYAAQGLGRFFAAIYLGYYHFGQLLYYQYLDELNGSRAGSPEVLRRVRRCKDFAMSLSRFIDTANATPGCDVRYYMVGHITVVASSVQIHTLLFGSDEVEIAASRAQLERNFNTLVSLRRYWPALETCFARLHSFHALCRKSMETTFRMDRWMLGFLTQFSAKLDEREREDHSDLDLSLWDLGSANMDLSAL